MARIAGVNIPTNKIVQTGLTYIYGIGDTFSKKICSALDIPNSMRVNELTDDQILKIREYIDGNFTVEGNLRRETSLSIKRLIDLASYRGSRHRKKLPVRGQRTRCNARTRKDDNYKTIAARYDVYMERTKPVLDFYSSLSYFHEIDGSQKIEVITSKIEHILNL